MAVASVSLGWHYALDGYVGAFLAVVVWWIAGAIERDVPEVATAPIADSSQPRRGFRQAAAARASCLKVLLL
jgi:hypothetical protein